MTYTAIVTMPGAYVISVTLPSGPGSGSGGSVDILDQDSNVIESVPAPGTYSVIVVSAIDGGDSTTGAYTNSIIVPIP